MLLAMLPPAAAIGSGEPAAGPVRIADPDAAPETVWRHASQACAPADYSDVPVRPFLGDGGKTLYWFASSSAGYFATIGAAGADRLARMDRLRNREGDCVVWVKGAAYASPAGVPQSYDTGLWMVAPFSLGGERVFALVHNEFHGELAGSAGAPSPYCNETLKVDLAGNGCSYWNIVAASSADGGADFRLYRQDQAPAFNGPVFAAPRPYLPPSLNGGADPGLTGMVAQSNIVKWGRYFYVLVQQVPSAVPAIQPTNGQRIGRNGVCIYRTIDLFDRLSWRGWNGYGYVVPTVPTYPGRGTDPALYTCTPVLNGEYRFSWSYNTVLRQFIVIGIDTKYGPDQTEAFIYTTAKLEQNGRFVQTSGEHFLMAIHWIDQWRSARNLTGEAYPSLLDPTSPEISDPSIPNPPGDFNFQYSGAHPYLYYTLFHPIDPAGDFNDRDVVRRRLEIRSVAGGPAADP